jgi:DNA-binding GntR family transcriptional regulator
MTFSQEIASSTSRDGTLKQQVYLSLKADILSGVFDMGERLNESQLSARYGVSRAPLRQALTMLQRDGLVEVLPRVGYLTSQLTPQDVSDIFELRLLLEASMAQRAADNISDAALDRMEQLCSPYRPGDRQSYRVHLMENLEYHRVIAEAAGNRRMTEVLIQAMEHMLRLLVLRLDMSSADDVIREHREMAEALRRRDGALARDLMVRHLTIARQATVDAIMQLTADRRL